MKKIMMMVLMMYLIFPITFSQQTNRECVHDGVSVVVYGSDHSYAQVGFISKTNPLDSLNVSYMVVQTMRVSGCEKNDVVVIYLTGGEKIIKNSWEGFNCEHQIFFVLNERDLFLLKNHTISIIRIKVSYPDDVVIPEQTDKDREMLPKFIVTGYETIDTNFISFLLPKLEESYKVRNDL